MLPLVRHLRTPSPDRHLRMPIILTNSGLFCLWLYFSPVGARIDFFPLVICPRIVHISLWRDALSDCSPAAVRVMAAHCMLSFALSPGLSQDDRGHTKEITNGMKKGRTEKENNCQAYSSLVETMKKGMGENNSCPHPPPLSYSHQRGLGFSSTARRNTPMPSSSSSLPFSGPPPRSPWQRLTR